MWNQLQCKEVVYILISYFDFAILMLSFRFANVQAAAVIYEVWPIILILIIARNTGERYVKVTKSIMLLLIIAFIGVGFVLFSQSRLTAGAASALDIISLLQGKALIGIVLAVLAAFITALTGYSWVWTHNMTRTRDGVVVPNPAIYIPDVIKYKITDRSPEYQTMFFLVILLFFTNIFALILNTGAGIVFAIIVNEYSTILNFDYLIKGVIGGILSYGIASLLWRYATSLTTNLGIHAMSYSTPVFSVIFLNVAAALFSVGIAQIINFPYLIIGAIAIISTNLLVNFEAEIRFGFKALILGLWACGTFVYLRNDLLQILPFASWVWLKGDVYLGALALSATLFILLLSFRVARLTGRTRDEDNAIIRLFQDVDLMARRNIIDTSIRQHILDVDAAHNPEDLQAAYHRAKTGFSEAAANAGSDDQARLADAEALLNIIVHSRGHGIEFGELFALVIFGGITVFLALASRPEVAGWAGFLFEVFAFLFSAVTVFLLANVWDLQGERAARVLQRQRDSEEYQIAFRDAGNRSFERWISAIIGMAIIVAYAYLLWQKWLP